MNRSESSLDLVQDLENQIQSLRSRIEKIQANEENFYILMKNYQSKIESLRVKYSKIERIKAKDASIGNEKYGRIELLNQQLMIVKGAKKSVITKSIYRIKELEKELEESQKQEHRIRTKLFKINQQKRLIDMSHNDFALDQFRSKTPNRHDLFHPDVSFLYRPSINRLYH